jgi:tRNA-splicing endonuclease subunit Sen34
MNKIDVYIVKSQLDKSEQSLALQTYLIFDYKSVKLLREKYRICGRLIGMISNVSKQTLTSNSYLPLKISTYEFYLLAELSSTESSIQFMSSPDFDCDLLNATDSKLIELKQNYDAYVEKLNEAKKTEYIRQRQEQLISMKARIIEGKRKKLNDQIKKLKENDPEYSLVLNQLDNLEADFDAEQTIGSISFDTENLNTEIFTKTPHFYQVLFAHKPVPQNDLKLLSDEANSTCKFKCYKYFWQQGYYLTMGAKFGGDFLAYAGDPCHYHAQFIIAVIENDEKLKSLSLKSLITFGRMATSVKKTFIIAYENENRLKFISLNWSHF